MTDQMRKSPLDLSGLSLIVGLGISGASAARFIHAHGGALRVIDSRTQPPGLDELRNLDIELVTGSLDPAHLDGVARIVLSPGLSAELPICEAARQAGIAVLNDIEIFARICPAPIIAVTGSNGKSTVVSLLDKMLQAAGVAAAAGGNLGPPALDLLERNAAVYVLEISSFQMEVAESLAPLAAAVLNISADHLDRHASVDAYAALKEKLLRNAQTAVINVDDPRVRAMGQRHRDCVEFSTQRVLARGYSVIDEALAVDGRPILPLAELTIAGRHNAANALAALALAECFTQQREPMLAAIREFRGLPHRCEFVANIDAATWVNDSKATNTGATNAALRGLPGPIVLIAGGVAKGADFRELRQSAQDKLRCAVLFGEAAADIAAAIGDVCECIHADSLLEAVAIARKQSRSGDTVLLSPACASFDMFSDYTERGRAFRNAVEDLS